MLRKVIAFAVIMAILATTGPATAQEDSRPFDLVPFIEGLDRPVFMTQPDDGSNRRFIVEQGGAIRVFSDGAILPDPLLDISSNVTGGSEQGLLGMALDPEFPENGLFFINFTDPDGDTQVVRYSVSSDEPNRADPASALTILSVDQPYRNHNGGMIAFGPDGYFYIGLGDGGSGGDPEGNAQNTSTLLGSILRIDVANSTQEAPYAIPPDNPFVGVEGAREEVWSFGLRNPWRFSFDRETGDMWIGDVGQSAAEEVDRQPAGIGGLNFGWNLTEGFSCYAVAECENLDITWPIFAYGRDLGISVIGGYVYHGPELPSLTGNFVFGDHGSGLIWITTTASEGNYEVLGPFETGANISSFAEDVSGSVYVVDLSGSIYLMTAQG